MKKTKLFIYIYMCRLHHLGLQVDERLPPRHCHHTIYVSVDTMQMCTNMYIHIVHTLYIYVYVK